jgi:tetratricopeptide (TPR) repeat protein
MKTMPLNEEKKKEIQVQPTKRLLNANNIVITLLIAVVVILAYPKVFNANKSKFDEALDNNKIIAVLPFINNTGDDSYDHWDNGISELLIGALSTSNGLTVIDNQTINEVVNNVESIQTASIGPDIAKEVATRINVKSYISGNYLLAGSTFRINLKLIDTKSSKVLRTEYAEGGVDSIFSMVGSLANAIKSYMEIAIIGEGTDIETTNYVTTSSPEAYMYFIQGMEDFWNGRIGYAIGKFRKSIEIDSTFTSAYFFLSIQFSLIEAHNGAKITLLKAYEGKHRLPMKMQLWLEAFNAQYINKNPHGSIRYFKQVSAIDPYSRLNWFWLGMSYRLIENYDEALLSFEKIQELDNQLGPWRNQLYYTNLGTTYQKLENYTKAQKIYREGFLLFPESEILARQQAVCALLQNDTSSANHYITLYRTALTKRIIFPEHLITAYIGRIYESAGRIEKAEEFLRLALEMRLNHRPELDTINPGNNLFWYYEALGTLLIDNDINVEEGIEKNQIAMDLSKEVYTDSHPLILYGQGSGYYKQGKYEESLQALRMAEEETSLYDHRLHQLILEVEQALADQNR